jgi:hypothetical protein
MPIIVDCPECGGRFKARDELTGRRVKCPKCGEAVSVPGEDEEPSVAAGPPRRSRSRAADDEYEDAPRRRKRPRDDDEDDDYDRPRKNSKKGLIIALCAGGGALLIGVGVLLFFLLGKGSSDSDLLIGKWEEVSPNKGVIIEFTKEGKFISGAFGGTTTVDYRLNGNELEIQIPPEKRETYKKLRQKAGKSGPDDTLTVKIDLTKDSLVIHPPDFLALEKKDVLKYKRIGSDSGGPIGQPDPRLQNDLRQIGLAYHNYFDAMRKAPSRAEDLMPFLEKDARLLNLLKKDIIFFYNVAPTAMVNGASNTVLAYHRDTPTRGGYVLFGDGVVERLSADQFRTKPKAGK